MQSGSLNYVYISIFKLLCLWNNIARIITEDILFKFISVLNKFVSMGRESGEREGGRERGKVREREGENGFKEGMGNGKTVR